MKLLLFISFILLFQLDSFSIDKTEKLFVKVKNLSEEHYGEAQSFYYNLTDVETENNEDSRAQCSSLQKKFFEIHLGLKKLLKSQDKLFKSIKTSNDKIESIQLELTELLAKAYTESGECADFIKQNTIESLSDEEFIQNRDEALNSCKKTIRTLKDHYSAMLKLGDTLAY